MENKTGYVILTHSRKKPGEVVALVDRSKHKDIWWTEIIEKAMVFVKESAAIIQKNKLLYNNPKVYTYEAGKKRLGQVSVPKNNRSHLGKMLDQHCAMWHDDDWYEGIND